MTRSTSSRFATIEPLESRIAPALLITGANLLGGAGNPRTAETSIGGDQVTLVKLISGSAIVWYAGGEIKGISFGPNTSLEITGDVHGDIIGNLTAADRLSDVDHDPSNGEDGNLLLANNLIGLKTFRLSGQKGAVENIITGGSISNLAINGEVHGIYAGDGAFQFGSTVLSAGVVTSVLGTGIDINPVALGNQQQFNFASTKGLAGAAGVSEFFSGASIKNVSLQLIKDGQIFAGNGSGALNGIGTLQAVGKSTALVAGGSVANITIESALISLADTAYTIHGGDGGRTDKGFGGTGGSVNKVIEKTSASKAKIFGGNGGDGTIAAGGAGGSVLGLDLQSDATAYTVTAGNGGQGVGGGAGGSVTNSNFANRTPSSSILLTANFNVADDATDLANAGLDDVLVVDSSTGDLVILKNRGDGATFTKIVQYTDNTDPLNPVDHYLVPTLGVTPVDGFVKDLNGDSYPDVVIAYKNSASLGLFYNDGHGVFVSTDPLLSLGTVTGVSVGLGFSPSLVSPDSVGGSSFAVVGSESGKSSVYRVERDPLSVTGYSTSSLATDLGLLATDLGPIKGSLYVGTKDGSILKLGVSGLFGAAPYSKSDTGIKITGGVGNLDFSSDGQQVLALSGAGHAVSVFTFQADGSLLLGASPDISGLPGRAVLAHFAKDSAGSDSVEVLSLLPSGSQINFYDALIPDADPLTVDLPFGAAKTLAAVPALKNFAVAYGSGGVPGVAAVAGSLNQFYFSSDLLNLGTFGLPFSTKTVAINGGVGGAGIDHGSVLGKGGAGGSIVNTNIEATDITLTAGAAGDSLGGAGGAGGSVTSATSFTTSSASVVAPTLIADNSLTISVGKGGTPATGGNATANGGDSGDITGLAIQLGSGLLDLSTKDGGAGKGGYGGAGGDISNVRVTHLGGSSNVTDVLKVLTGDGGNASGLTKIAKAGNAGIVSGLKFTLDLVPAVEKLESLYGISVVTGNGGVASNGAGGNGGAVKDVSLKLDGADESAGSVDSTISIAVATGNGGAGTTLGGAGGVVSGFTSYSVFDQQSASGGISLNYVVLSMSAGNGGAASAGIGGMGGSIGFGAAGLSGITNYDPDSSTPVATPLTVLAGSGGSGSTKGGIGGSVSNLLAKNSPFIDESAITTTHLQGAFVSAGNGGAGGTMDGGKGGDVSGATLAVDALGLVVISGDGGTSTSAKGGDGGAILNSTFAAISSPLFLASGLGGSGAAGGKGGLISTLKINTSQRADGRSADVLAGDGGDSTGAAKAGGIGGSIKGITQDKDLNSTINLLQAGNGGASTLGAGGLGGSVNTIKTVGFIGKRSSSTVDLGVFDESFSVNNYAASVQGIFAGRGGSGTVAGLAGSVGEVTARQISAIAAAVNSSGLFGAATKVSAIKADVIGYDIGTIGTFQTGVPNAAVPTDGFILAKSIVGLTTVSPTLFQFLV